MTQYCWECYEAVNMFKDPVPESEYVKLVYLGRTKSNTDQLTLEGEHIKAKYSYYFKCPICKTVKVFELGENYGIDQWVNRTKGVCPKCHTTVKDWHQRAWESGNDVEFIVDIAYCKKCGLEFTIDKPRRGWQYYNWMKKYIGKCDKCKVGEAPNCWYWYPREKVQFD